VNVGNGVPHKKKKQTRVYFKQAGVTLPSNLQGLYRCDYEGNRLEYDATMKLLKTFSQFS